MGMGDRRDERVMAYFDSICDIILQYHKILRCINTYAQHALNRDVKHGQMSSDHWNHVILLPLDQCPLPHNINTP